MPFRAPMKVCFGDIDNAWIVYYPRFMHYFHLAIEEFSSTQLGIDFSDVLHKRKISIPTVHMESDFHRRLECDDRALGWLERADSSLQITCLVSSA